MSLQQSFAALASNRWKVSNTTVSERRVKLQRLKEAIIDHREEIKKALHDDFKKPAAEVELTEIHASLEEINFARKNLKKWLKPKRVNTPIFLLGTKSKIYKEAKGVVLIMAPWNYPFYLMMSPLVSAISAGCVCMLRPSEKTPQTSLIIKKICDQVFLDNEANVQLGGLDVSVSILDLPFDHIFFTGSTKVGKIVMEKASKHLASVTLELGGKSPVIVDETADLEQAAEKITWGKYLNAGQTCVAPDYVFVHDSVKEDFLKLVRKKIKNYYGDSINERKSTHDFARIIDEQSFDRLSKLIKDEKTLMEDTPSKEDDLFIPPSVLCDVTLDSPIMKEEIFGPVLPVISYKKLEEVIEYVKENGKPLALYVFSKKEKNISRILKETSSGGVVVNHVIMHLVNPYLPFGGVGASGMGAGHGEFGFKAFSHEKAVLSQGRLGFSSLLFPPYGGWLSKTLFKVLRYFE